MTTEISAPPAVKHNLIVPCGTSQLEGDKLRGSLIGISYEVSINFYETKLVNYDENVVFDPPTERWLSSQEVQPQVQFIVQKLGARDGELGGFIGRKDNPFGAELSTLFKLKEEGSFVPAHDRLVLLASETYSGVLAAGIIRKYLVDCWNMPEASVELLIVHGMRERNVNPEDVGSCLAEYIIQNLKEHKDKDMWSNTIVMSGGFKSIIPCLTIFSLLYGIRLVYLFESSDRLQSLQPWLALDDSKQLDTFEKYLQKLSQDWGDRAGMCFRKAIQYRLQHLKVIYNQWQN